MTRSSPAIERQGTPRAPSLTADRGLVPVPRERNHLLNARGPVCVPDLERQQTGLERDLLGVRVRPPGGGIGTLSGYQLVAGGVQRAPDRVCAGGHVAAPAEAEVELALHLLPELRAQVLVDV